MYAPIRVLATAAAAAVLALAVGGPARASSTSSAPFSDPQSAGSITFCNKAGQPVTSGSIDAKPFVWRAVSTRAAAAPYNSVGRTATLAAYQPRQGFAPGDWSGDELTASTNYVQVAHPTAVATGADESLSEFMGEFAPQWDGTLELRLILGAPGQEPSSVSYPSTVIKVTGQTWQVLSPVSGTCASGRAESLESQVLPNHHHHKLAPGSSTTSKTSGKSNSPGPRTAPASSAPTSVALQSSTSSSNSHGTEIGIGIAAAVIVLAGGALLARRHSSGSTKGTT